MRHEETAAVRETSQHDASGEKCAREGDREEERERETMRNIFSRHLRARVAVVACSGSHRARTNAALSRRFKKLGAALGQEEHRHLVKFLLSSGCKRSALPLVLQGGARSVLQKAAYQGNVAVVGGPGGAESASSCPPATPGPVPQTHCAPRCTKV